MNKILRRYYEKARMNAYLILMNKHKREYKKIRKKEYLRLLKGGLK